jgi:hypothetical protein
MRKRNKGTRQSAVINEERLNAHLQPGANRHDVWRILTQVACEAESYIRSASGGTCLSCLSYIERNGCVSEKTKVRLLNAHMRMLAREVQRKSRANG